MNITGILDRVDTDYRRASMLENLENQNAGGDVIDDAYSLGLIKHNMQQIEKQSSKLRLVGSRYEPDRYNQLEISSNEQFNSLIINDADTGNIILDIPNGITSVYITYHVSIESITMQHSGAIEIRGGSDVVSFSFYGFSQTGNAHIIINAGSIALMSTLIERALAGDIKKYTVIVSRDNTDTTVAVMILLCMRRGAVVSGDTEWLKECAIEGLKNKFYQLFIHNISIYSQRNISKTMLVQTRIFLKNNVYSDAAAVEHYTSGEIRNITRIDEKEAAVKLDSTKYSRDVGIYHGMRDLKNSIEFGSLESILQGLGRGFSSEACRIVRAWWMLADTQNPLFIGKAVINAKCIDMVNMWSGCISIIIHVFISSKLGEYVFGIESETYENNWVNGKHGHRNLSVYDISLLDAVKKLDADIVDKCLQYNLSAIADILERHRLKAGYSDRLILKQKDSK